MPGSRDRAHRRGKERRRRRDRTPKDGDPSPEDHGDTDVTIALVGDPGGSAGQVAVTANKVPLVIASRDEEVRSAVTRYIEARQRSKRIRRKLDLDPDERGVDHLYAVLHDLLDDIDFIIDEQVHICNLDPETKQQLHDLDIAALQGKQMVDIGIGKWRFRLRRVWVTTVYTAAITAFLKIVLADGLGIPIPFLG